MFLSNLLTLPYRCPLCISYLHSQIWLLPTWLKHTVITVTSFKLLEAYFYNEYTTFPRKLHFIKWTFRKTLWGFYHTAKRTFSCWLAFGRALSMKMPSGKKARTLRLQNPFVFFLEDPLTLCTSLYYNNFWGRFSSWTSDFLRLFKRARTPRVWKWIHGARSLQQLSSVVCLGMPSDEGDEVQPQVTKDEEVDRYTKLHLIYCIASSVSLLFSFPRNKNRLDWRGWGIYYCWRRKQKE